MYALVEAQSHTVPSENVECQCGGPERLILLMPFRQNVACDSHMFIDKNIL
jgi:hypothetical protein